MGGVFGLFSVIIIFSEDNGRPKLVTPRGEQSTNYINAAVLDVSN